MRPTEARPQFHLLTHLRAVTALWVVIYHTAEWGHISNPIARKVSDLGFLGVDIFFCLSGMVIHWNYRDSTDTKSSFLGKRLARIYPTHAFVTLLYVLAAALLGQFGENGFRLHQLVENILLAQCLPWVGSGPTWNLVSWSLSCEWLAYIFYILALRRVVTGVRAASTVAFLSIAVSYGSMLALYGTTACTDDRAIWRIAGMFIAGTCVAELRKSHSPPAWSATASISAIALACLAIPSQKAAIAIVLLTPITIWGLTTTAQAGRREKRLSRALGTLGKQSFALYLIHPITSSVANKALDYLSAHLASQLGPTIRMTTILATCYGMAAVTYHLVEKPAHRLMTRRGDAATNTLRARQ